MAKYAPYVREGTYPINASIDGASYSVPPASPLNTGEANIDINMTLLIHESVNFAILITDDKIQYFSALSSDGHTLPN
jgi:tripeptidyl-peptidase-1